MPPADRPAARGLPAWLLAASSAGSAAMVAVGVSLRSGLGTWLACCAVGGWVLGAGSILAARRLMDRPQPAVWQARPTGATLQPCPFPQEAPAAFRWIGGCNVPGNLGRLNATFPLAVLEVAPGSAALRVRRTRYGCRLRRRQAHDLRPGWGPHGLPRAGKARQ